MNINYTKNREQIITLGNVKDILKFKCIECATIIFIENGIDGIRCKKCQGHLKIQGKANPKELI